MHGALLALLIGLWRIEPAQEIVLPPVTLKIEGKGGSAGTPGGGGGDAARPGEARNANTNLQASATSPETPAPTPQKTPDITPLKPKPVQKPLTQTQTKPPLPRPQAKPQPQPIPAVIAPPVPLTPAPTPSTASLKQPNATAPAPAGAGSGSEGASSAGDGNVGSGHGIFGSGSGDPDAYLDQLRRWINRYKKYPDDALKKKEEGTVVISFTLAHDGTVTGTWIEKSSGNPLLDAAALQMMHDASPVPAVPPKYWSRTGPITVPVDFSIGFFNRILP